MAAPNMAAHGLYASQAGTLLATAVVVPLWLYAEAVTAARRRGGVEPSPRDPESGSPVVKDAAAPAPAKDKDSLARPDRDQMTFYLRLASMQPAAAMAALPTLRNVAELAAIMAYVVLCDRTEVFGVGTKVYSRDVFAFVYGCLTFAAFCSSLRKHEGSKLLNREVTEEWKGWMQVLFLLYHYYNAGEMYNSIRLYIAGYVWMTGFGNFSYYYIRKDFSAVRFMQMMWRLNFLVFVVCCALGNSYMLYYICPMHTLFTLMVYACLGIRHEHNESDSFMLFKIAAVTLATVVMWEVPGVFKAVWSPLSFLLGYEDPRHPEVDAMHEWEFRSGLDRYVWIVGMLYAFFHPALNRGLERLDELPAAGRVAAQAALAACAVGAMFPYYQHVFRLGKYEYNAWHPYTSWIPITAFIVLRNLTAQLRSHSVQLFQYLGKITLETYIMQFSIWMLCRQRDAQPKLLLEFVPGYPLVNFGLVTMVYVGVANRLFVLTNELKKVALPNNKSVIAANAVAGGCMLAVLYTAGAVAVTVS